MSKKAFEVSVRSELAAEMRQAIVEMAGERGWNETRLRWLDRAAREAGISYRAARALFYLEPHEPRGSVVERVQRAVQEKRAEKDTRDGFQNLIKHLEALEAVLLAMDSEVFGEGLDALRGPTRDLRNAACRDGKPSRR